MKMKFDERRNEWVAMTRTERVVEAAVEAVCAVFALVAFVLSLWLYCAATPDQRTAECDLIYAQTEAMPACSTCTGSTARCSMR